MDRPDYDDMRIGLGQVVCLVAGALLVSLGGGLFGGRLAVEKYRESSIGRPGKAAESFETSPATKSPETFSAGAEQPLERGDVTADMPAMAGEKEPASLPAKQTENSAAAPASETAGSSESSHVKYVIQTLSATNRRDARAAREQIMAKGFPAGIFEADLGDKGKWFRVIVGPYESAEEAQAAVMKIHDIPGFQGSFVRPVK